MRKVLLILIGSPLLFSVALAQKSEKAEIIIHYKFGHIRDTTQRANVYHENMMLLIGKSSSVYKSYDRKMRDSYIKKQVIAQMATSPGKPANIPGGAGPATFAEYFLFFSENKLVRKERLIELYLITEPIPVINWAVNADTATIGGMHCQKALGYFKGRNYTAWFCAEIPSRSGPWKLNGLPGAILEAYDSKKEIEFRFDGIEYPNKVKKSPSPTGKIQKPASTVQVIGIADPDDDSNPIELPVDGVETTEKAFLNLERTLQKNTDALSNSGLSAGGQGNSGSSSMKNDGPREMVPAVIKNPIELPEGQ